ncbi:hypothetical protein BRADI_4g24372v3 [Brachypodium distachyon]|uniref:Uncharacterized protein n=1 Tax=Brachypodium distachyon TaxID=15368 RepID=A0A2K2CPY3_BRADI|nr:hypothetical protein BRADI_4g24372v3 [Brachypodium distachyon]
MKHRKHSLSFSLMHSILRNKQKIPCVGLHINRRAASDGSVSPYIPGGPWLVRSRTEDNEKHGGGGEASPSINHCQF